VIGQVPHRPADPYGGIIPQKAPDLTQNHRHPIGGKPHLQTGVKIVDCLNQPNAPNLEQVVQVFASACKFLHHAQHKAQVALYHLGTGFAVSGFGSKQQLGFLFLVQHRQQGRVHAAYFHFAGIHSASSRSFAFSNSSWFRP